ncbi:MAG TPA: Hsp20/alpha crystallin family protein [Gemmatimonadales bacterium]|jgi:HSP20 family protein|nr:Hsp20/alpha crystallin family protein [Gemmatimonadales bacterium]
MKVATLTPTVGKMRNEIDKVFDRFFTAPFLGEPLAFPLEPMREYGAEWMPVLDLAETPKEYVVRLEAPGIHKENLDINLTGNVLRITGHREAVQEGKDETYLYREREVGKFARVVRLPVPVEGGKIDAAFQDGILTIRLPKVEAAVAKKILIK